MAGDAPCNVTWYKHGSHSDPIGLCHPTQVNAPALTPAR